MRKRNGFIPLERNTSVSNKFLAGYNTSTKKMLNSFRFLTGFTLVEVLVVIAVIAILMAIIMPSLTKARRQAMAVVCQSRLKQWGTVFYMYVEDNHGRFFRFFVDALWFIRGSQLEEGDPNTPPMSTYIITKGIGCCPLATTVSDDPRGFFGASSSSPSGSYRIEGISGSAFEAWEITSPAPAFHGSYGFNHELFRPTFYSSPMHSRPFFNFGIDVYNLDRANRFPVLLDCASIGDSIRVLPLPHLLTNQFCIDRHDGCINGLFMDWSVRKIGLKELWTLKWNEDFDTANRWTLAGGVQPEDWPEWMRGLKDY
jgi:prepilin-type N-terminal cleavage/methylation domain-containing protein